MHIAVAIVEKNREFLIVRRRKKEGSLLWQFPAGAVENSEADNHAAERETFEETNIRCKAVKQFGERIHPETNVKVSYWLCEYVEGLLELKDKEELDQAKWASGKDVLSSITSDLYPPIREYIEESIMRKQI